MESIKRAMLAVRDDFGHTIPLVECNLRQEGGQYFPLPGNFEGVLDFKPNPDIMKIFTAIQVNQPLPSRIEVWWQDQESALRQGWCCNSCGNQFSQEEIEAGYAASIVCYECTQALALEAE